MTLLTTLLLLLPFSLSPLALALPGHGGGGHHDSCKRSSLHNPELTVEDFAYKASYTYSTPAHLIASGQVSFNLVNDLVDPPTNVSCNAYSSWLQNFFYGVVWYTCEDGATAFRYNYPTGELELNTTWTCDGRKGRDATFNATYLGELPTECVEDSWQNPNWTMGQIYSTQLITCSVDEATILPEVELVES